MCWVVLKAAVGLFIIWKAVGNILAISMKFTDRQPWEPVMEEERSLFVLHD